MIFVKINDDEYKINWNYSLRLCKVKDLKESNVTRCVISKKTNIGWHIISASQAVCIPTDQFCKAIGRKLSYTRALEKISFFGKSHRQVFWDTYNNRSNIIIS